MERTASGGKTSELMALSCSSGITWSMSRARQAASMMKRSQRPPECSGSSSRLASPTRAWAMRRGVVASSKAVKQTSTTRSRKALVSGDASGGPPGTASGGVHADGSRYFSPWRMAASQSWKSMRNGVSSPMRKSFSSG